MTMMTAFQAIKDARQTSKRITWMTFSMLPSLPLPSNLGGYRQGLCCIFRLIKT